MEVRAAKITMYPGERVVAEDVKIYLMGKHIYSRDRFVSRLDGEGTATIVPRIGYDNDHGVELKFKPTIPLNEKDVLSGELLYYSKDGLKGMFEATHDEDDFYIRYNHGYAEDDDNNWVKKKNNIGIYLRPWQILQDIPVNLTAGYSNGIWEEDGVKSRHQEYKVRLDHQPITWGDTFPVTLNLGVGHKWTEESVNDSMETTLLYNASISKKFPLGWDTYAGYYWERTENPVFEYEKSDMARELQWGVGKTFDLNNRVEFVTRYDAGQHEPYEYIYRYIHDFCCWRLKLIYTDEQYKDDHSVKVKFDLYRW